MIISIQGKTQSKGRAATCARNGFKAFSLSMMAIKAMNSVTASPGHHTAYVKNDGDLWTTGKNSDGQLGLFHSSDVDTPTIVSVGNFAVSLGGGGASLGGGGGGVSLGGSIHFGVAKVAIGNGHTIYVREQNGIHYAFSSGRNNAGQLGLGHQYSQSWISHLPFSESVHQVAAGDDFSLFLTRSGALYGTGANNIGQLGLGHDNNVTSPQLIRQEGVRQVAAGFHHSLYVMKDGSLWGTGRNLFGQLGLGDQVDRNRSTLVFPSGVRQVSAGKRHSLIVKTDGSLWAMGRNHLGQLGTGDTNDSLVPTLIEPGGVKQASAGLDHSLYIKWDGTLWGMGNNNYGELGLGNQSTLLIPVQIDGNVTQVAAGFDHTHYLKTDGTLWAMGGNSFGSLGTGDKLMKTTPVQVDSNVMRLADVPDDWPVLEKLTNPYGASNDNFGSSLDQSGNFLSVGASSADPGGISNAGAAYLYQMDTIGSATFVSTVTAPDKAASDQFGNSISISGNVLAVAASGADPAGISNAGAAYLFQLENNGSVTFLSKVTAPDKAASDSFGNSISISGNILAVAASGADPGGISNAGAAYLFQLENNGSATFLSKVTAPDKATSDSFGNSISISGNILAVGAYGADPGGKNSAGAAYLFQLENNGSATFLSKVTAPNGAANDSFGKSVSLSGNILAVGAYGVSVPGKNYVGAAYVYNVESNGSATLLTQINPPNNPNFDNFGFCVSLDGKTLSVGAGYGSAKGFIQAGAVYVYHLENNDSATLLTKLTAPDAAANKYFGMRVSLSGSILAASAYDPNAAYLFDLSTLPRSLPGDRDGDGFSDALEANATTNPDSNLSFPSLDFGLLARYPLGGTTVVHPGKIEPDTFPGKELGIHFDASAIQGLSNFANVTVWQDLSGNGRHMNNVPSAPRWIASEPTLNNKPVVDFNESQDRMWTTYNFRASDQVAKWRDEGWTAIAVARYTAGPGGDSERLISSNGGGWTMGFQGNKVNRHYFDGWVDQGDAHDNNWHLFSVVHQGNSINADPQSWTYDLGSPRVSANTASNNDWHMPQRLEFGAYNNNSENSMGQIAEFLMYHGMLTDEQRQKIESHLAFKYGLTLDANHPFGSTVDALDKTVEVPTDLSGNERNGTARNTLLRPDRYGRHGKALGFSDHNQTIFLPELPAGDHGFTVMGWVRSDSNGGEIFSLGDESLSGLFLHLEANGSISWGTGHPTLRAYANAPSNTWYHLAATYQPGTHLARIYLNGVLADSATLLGGFEPALYAKQALPLGSLDLSGGMASSHAVRSQSAFVASSGGTVRFRVNSGTAGDIYRAWMGNLCLFSAGNAFTGPDHTQNYDDPSFAFSANGWRTSGSAANGDDDLIEITFAPGQPTTYKITPGASNNDGTGNSVYNSYDSASGLYANVLTNDLPPGAADKTLTLQVETTTLGMIYGEGDSANNDADNSGTPGPSFTAMTSPRIGYGFDGGLDDFRLYSRPLQLMEITQIKNTESAPSDLNSTAPLTIAENQPIGTVVGEFNATDPDANAILTYSLVSGPGDGNNSLFTLDQNGTLKTATTFDFESNISSYAIRVEVKDENNGSTQKIFTVSLTDDLADNPPKTIFVKASASGLNDGTTWTDAYSELQNALTVANAGDEIRVAAGTYKPTSDGNRSLSFTLKNGVIVLGSYAGIDGNNDRNWTTYPTILSGDIGVQADNSDNSYHVVKAVDCNASTMLDGFTIREARAYGPGAEDKKGGGIYVLRGAPVLRNLKLLSNEAEQGAGIFINDSDATFTDSRLQGNTAIRGGGMVTRGTSTTTLSELIFVENEASQIGGGIDGKRITAEKLKFSRNKSPKGGAISVEDSYLHLKHCLFRDNNSSSRGGALKVYNSHFTISNSVFHGNRADMGGAIHLDKLGSPGSSYLFEHLTLFDNHAQTSGSAFYSEREDGKAQLKNSIVWGNVSAGKTLRTDDPADFNVTHSILQGSGGSLAWVESNATDAGNNLDIDPQFLSSGSPLGADGYFGTADDGLQLSSSSPAIDVGSPTSTLFDALDGNRTVGNAPDLGAYESQSLLAANTAPTDLNYTAPLAFSENQPIGTVVGEFNATEPDLVGVPKKTFVMIEQNGSWAQAKSLAATADAADPFHRIYLATIGSEQEHNQTKNFPLSKGLNGAWLGGNDAAVEGEWRWTEGPEGEEDNGAGRLFWNNGPVAGNFSKWESPNPNNGAANANEHYLLIRSTQEWNDATGGHLPAYVIEKDRIHDLIYSLVPGAGDTHNSLFTLDQNGTLKTATTFDFETNASSYSIRVQAKDEFNASIEGNFTVILNDMDDRPAIVSNGQLTKVSGTEAIVRPTVGQVGGGLITVAPHGPSEGVGLTLFWGHADGGTNPASWANQVPLGNHFGKVFQPGFQAYGHMEVFSDSVEHLLTLTPDGSAITLGDPSNPTANGMYFNHISDYRNAGIGITNSRFTALFVSTLTPQTTGNHKFRLNRADDQAWVWLDLDQDGNLSSTGAGGDEKLIRANQEFGPADVSTPDIPLVAGQQYKFALISSNYGGGGNFRPWVQTPGGSMEVINPSAPSQAGLFSVVKLSNGQPLSSQSLLEANVSGLVPGASYFYRVRATNSLGDYWAGSTSSFVAAHPLEFNATHGPLYFSEKQPIGSIVGNFEAMDANATLTYAFSEGFPKKVFELNGTYLAGEIVEANGSLWRVKTSLAPNGVFDSNSIFTYGMAARVSDGNGSFFESAIDFSSISAWDRYRSYALNELVSYNGNLYLSNAGSGNSARTPGVHPYWTLQDVGLAGTYWTSIGSKTQLGGEFWEAYLSPYDNHLFTLDANGTLRTATTFDYERNATSYSIRIQVRDEHNASLDRNFTVSLNELYEAPPKAAPTDLNSTAPLTIAENQPVGTFVGQFTANDADANATLSYRLANGPGSQHNNRFSLDANGTLRTAKVFDYENRSVLKIRVRVANEHNVSIQEAFIVSVTDLAESNVTTPDSNGTQVLPIDSNATSPDVNATEPGTPAGDLFQPIVETGEAKKVSKVSATLRGSLIDNGGARISKRGFLLSERPNPKPGRKNVSRLDANGSKNFQAQATNLKPGKKYYYRAFATNAQGTALGSVESFTTTAGPLSPSWINAQPGAAANWWTSRWFGNFYLNANGWARHEQLGWVFPMESPTAGLWLWKRDLGWIWTDKEIYPFLYQNAQGGWLYFYGQRKSTLLFYDYEAKRWISKEDRQ